MPVLVYLEIDAQISGSSNWGRGTIHGKNVLRGLSAYFTNWYLSSCSLLIELQGDALGSSPCLISQVLSITMSVTYDNLLNLSFFLPHNSRSLLRSVCKRIVLIPKIKGCITDLTLVLSIFNLLYIAVKINFFRILQYLCTDLNCTNMT